MIHKDIKLEGGHSITVRASASISDYVLMDPGSNPHQATLFIYLNCN